MLEALGFTECHRPDIVSPLYFVQFLDVIVVGAHRRTVFAKLVYYVGMRYY